MNVGLKREVLDAIKQHLITGNCDEVREMLSKISGEYSRLNGYFAPKYELTETISVKPNPLVLKQVGKCLDKYQFNIVIEGDVYTVELLSRYDEWSEDFYDPDVEMWIKNLTPDMLEKAIKKINEKKKFCWVMSGFRELTGEEFVTLLEREEYSDNECSNVITLKPTDNGSIYLTNMSAWFKGEIRVGNILIYVRGDIDTYELLGNLWGSKLSEAILRTVKELWDKYRDLNPTITLSLRLG